MRGMGIPQGIGSCSVSSELPLTCRRVERKRATSINRKSGIRIFDVVRTLQEIKVPLLDEAARVRGVCIYLSLFLMYCNVYRGIGIIITLASTEVLCYIACHMCSVF